MDINNLELYKIFYTVASTGNISRAAEVLYTGQPSVSKTIKRLEESLQTRLFIRNPKGVALTSDGKILLEYITKALQEIYAGELAIKKSTENTFGKLILGISSTLYKYFIFPNIKDFLEAHPNFTVSIVDNSKSCEIIEAVKKGAIDVGVASKPLLYEGIDFIPISTVEEIMVSAPNYIDRFDVSDLHTFFDQVPLIFLENGNVAREYNEQYLRSLGISVSPEIVTSNMNFIIELVMLGVGVGIVYKEAIQRELKSGELVELNFLPKIPKREIGIVLKKNELRSFTVREFVDFYSR